MASNYIYDNVDPNANIIFGALVDEKLGDKVRITVLATGFDTVPGGKAAQNVLPMGIKKDQAKASSPSFPGSTAPSPAPPALASAAPAQQRMATSAAAAAAEYDDEPLPAATPAAAPRQPAYQQQAPSSPPQAAPDQSFLQSFRRM